MNEESKLVEFRPTEDAVEGCAEASSDETQPPRLRNEGFGILGLHPDGQPNAVWSIADLSKRAQAIDFHVTPLCEHPAWVPLIRSVNTPLAGKLGADLQARIGSEEIWKEERAKWKLILRKKERALNDEKKEFQRFFDLNKKLQDAKHLLITRATYTAQAYADWVWDLEHLPDDMPTSEQVRRSVQKAIESDQTWKKIIEATEKDLRFMKYDYDSDASDLNNYIAYNAIRQHIGDGKITRAEYFLRCRRSFNPNRLDWYEFIFAEHAFIPPNDDSTINQVALAFSEEDSPTSNEEETHH